MKTIILFLLANLYLTECLTISSKSSWNDLKVTWGFNPFNSNYFSQLPQKESDAVRLGWTKDKDCSQNFRGSRYLLKSDKAILIIFDQSGQIAGIGTTIPKGLPYNFPSKNIQPYLVDEGDSFVSYLYFTEPSTICSKSYFSPKTFGDKLIIVGDQKQISMPMSESEVDSFWTKGKCFVSMGVHYWADVTGPGNYNTKADNFFPIFGLYNKGVLNGFGWVFTADLDSNRYEHPPYAQTLPLMLFQVPSFFNDPTQFGGKLSAIHVFFDSNPRLNNFC